MTDRPASLEAKPDGYQVTRFNALKHGVLSHDTVLSWENESEYDALFDALIAEHQPQGPTEEHLVEELAGIMWRKRRLRLAEAAAHPSSGARRYCCSPRPRRCCPCSPDGRQAKRAGSRCHSGYPKGHG
jgi:hypothetical protein